MPFTAIMEYKTEQQIGATGRCGVEKRGAGGSLWRQNAREGPDRDHSETHPLLHSSLQDDSLGAMASYKEWQMERPSDGRRGVNVPGAEPPPSVAKLSVWSREADKPL